MIRGLHLTDVGPAEKLAFDFSSRLNLFTGDNGLGKSFVLDVLWWLVTTTWVGEPAYPNDLSGQQSNNSGKKSSLKPYVSGAKNAAARASGTAGVSTSQIEGTLGWRTGVFSDEHELGVEAHYDRLAQNWVSEPWSIYMRPKGKRIREEDIVAESAIPESLVVYFRIDGSVAIWDSYQIAPFAITPTTPAAGASDPLHPFRAGFSERLSRAAISLSTNEVWEGRDVLNHGQERRRIICRGLIEDWVSWQGTRAHEFDLLCRVLHGLSEPDEPIMVGKPQRVRLDDRRDIPTLETAYGRVPVTLASAGMKRILTLAYVLIWAWTEHQKAAKLIRRRPSQDMIVLIDEVELHLHPQWQRVLLPALLRAIGTLAPNVGVQLFATTHSPLVLASLEPVFEPGTDQLLSFSLARSKSGRQKVRVEKMHWRTIGDAAAWLTNVFGLKYARSREAEEALLKATKALDKADLTNEQLRKIHHDLLGVLRDTDPFWARWKMVAEKLGIEP